MTESLEEEPEEGRNVSTIKFTTTWRENSPTIKTKRLSLSNQKSCFPPHHGLYILPFALSGCSVRKEFECLNILYTHNK